MDTIKSVCAAIWDGISDFTQSVWQWTRDKIGKFFDWFSTTLGDLIAIVKNCCNSPALDSKDKNFVAKFTVKLQDVNDDLPELKRIIEQANQSGSDHDKEKAAETMKTAGNTFRQFGMK